MAERSYPSPKVGAETERAILQWCKSGREEPPQVRGQGQRPRGATPRPRSGGWVGAKAKRSYSTFKVRRGSGEEIPLIHGKEQQLCFAGAAVKRYPTSKVGETQVRW